MVLSYDGVYLWKKAVEKAGTFDVDKVRTVLESGDISFDGPGGLITMQANHHATKNVYIGETKADGQFKIIQTFKQVYGQPFLKGTFMKGGASAGAPPAAAPSAAPAASPAASGT
jgi:urea transport system substrate-binding protein